MRFLLFLILFLSTYSAFASIDLNFNEPPEISPYKYRGEKDNNGDGIRDEVYYKYGNKEMLIKDIEG